jgi:hypothetical protein
MGVLSDLPVIPVYVRFSNSEPLVAPDVQAEQMIYFPSSKLSR